MLVRKLVDAPAEFTNVICDALTPDVAAAAWTQLKLVEEVTRRVREGLYAFAREHPVLLPNGVVLGEVETQRRAVDGRVAFDVLTRLHGDEVARAAVELDASQASIERALRPVAEATGAKLSALKRTVMAELEQFGAISVRTSRSVREHAPARQEPPSEAA